MALLPVRGLAKLGIVQDVAPYDLPLNAWTGGTNVRFANGKTQRSPVFRRAVGITPTLADAAGITVFQPTSGFDSIFAVDSNGRVGLYSPGVGVSDVSEVGFAATPSDHQFTSCFLGDVLYLNRETAVPRYWSGTSSQWAVLPNWDSTWRANILRSFFDFLVAFGVTKGADVFGSMVKWSGATLIGSPPPTWDSTDPTNLSGENPLSQMNGPIIDAANLRNVMMIYGSRQAWMMEYTGDKTFPMSFSKVMDDMGCLSRNCAIEVEGKHYIFGPTDIWVTDGTQKDSIANGRVRDYVFGSMNLSKARACFVFHDPNQTAVGFAFPCMDASVPFSTDKGCNRAAMFNYRDNTWGYHDLPCVGGAALANSNTTYSWASIPADLTWDTAGGSWGDQADGFKPAPFFVGNADGTALTDARLYALDPMDKNTRVALPADAEANTPAWVERVGIDLDEANLPLTTYKLVRSVTPQARIYRDIPVTLAVGIDDTPQGVPSYAPALTFNPITQRALNVRVAGSYLSFKLQVTDLADFEFTGVDLDVISGGKRQ